MDRVEIDEAANCACGDVKVAARGSVLSMLMCTCRDCRKATGAGHSAAVLMRRKDVSVSGAVKGFARTANSGAEIVRHFCPECGTPLYAVSSRTNDLILLPAGLFDDPQWFEPGQVIFARSHMEWDALPENLPQYRTYKTEGGL